MKHVVRIRFKMTQFSITRTIKVEAYTEEEVNELLRLQLEDLEASGVYKIVSVEYYNE